MKSRTITSGLLSLMVSSAYGRGLTPCTTDRMLIKLLREEASEPNSAYRWAPPEGAFNVEVLQGSRVTHVSSSLRLSDEINKPERENLEHLRDMIDSRASGRASKVRAAVIPMVGSRASYASLFPNARVIVGIDAQPLTEGGRSRGDPIAFRDRYLPSFRYTEDEQNEPARLQTLLGTLQTSIPDFRVQRIILFSTSPRVEGGRTPRNGIIEYRCGNDPTIRQFVFINDRLLTNGEATVQGPSPWWYDNLNNLKPDAAVIAGANNQFSRGYGPNAIALRSDLISWLTETHGVAIESSGQGGARWEFSDGGLPAGARVLGSPVNGLGYGSVRALYFGGDVP